ncbi:hypothetical protein IJD34_00085 [bacterium]|nr:hypothetical protein [bacterium]
MLIEDLIFEIRPKKDGLKHINNYIVDEISENWYGSKGINDEDYDKLMGLLHANSSVIEFIEKILISYQDKIDNHYAELLKTEM